MLADPASAEFDDMKRAVRKDISGQPVDAICGHVKEKKGPSGRPFVYLVKEDKAYIDDGYPESVATTWYRAVCTDADAPGQASRQPPSKRESGLTSSAAQKVGRIPHRRGIQLSARLVLV
jgi:hypothetical protein